MQHFTHGCGHEQNFVKIYLVHQFIFNLPIKTFVIQNSVSFYHKINNNGKEGYADNEIQLS